MMDSKIIRLRYEYLRNEAHAAYHESVMSLFGQFTPATLNIQPQYAAYHATYNTELLALDLIRHSKFTAEIEEQDARRDAVYRGFADTVKGATKHFDPARAEAARGLQSLLDHYGNIADKPANDETAAIDDLLRELSGGYQTQLTTLALGEWTAQLTSENTLYKTLVASRYAETAARPDVQMKAARKELDAAFRSLLNQVDALVMVSGAANYDAFIAALNAISERYKNTLAQEAGARKASSDSSKGVGKE